MKHKYPLHHMGWATSSKKLGRNTVTRRSRRDGSYEYTTTTPSGRVRPSTNAERATFAVPAGGSNRRPAGASTRTPAGASRRR